MSQGKRVGFIVVLLIVLIGVTAWLLSKSEPKNIGEGEPTPAESVGKIDLSTASATGTPDVSATNSPGAQGSTSSTPTPGATQNTVAGAFSDTQTESSDPTAPFRIPSIQTIREEVERNPHGTPLVITHFGQDLARRLEEAKRSPEQGTAFFNRVENCALGKASGGEPMPQQQQAPDSILALCALKARQIAKAFPEELQDRNNDLQQKVSPQVRNLIAAMDQLGN